MLIKDDQNRNMFERGSAQIMPFFKTLLVELAPVFDSLDNKIIITGHTDAMAYKNNIYNNWSAFGRSRAFGPSGAGRGWNAGR